MHVINGIPKFVFLICRKTQEDKENGKKQPEVNRGSESGSIMSILVKKGADVNTALGT